MNRGVLPANVGKVWSRCLGRVVPDGSGCWVWTGAKTRGGYGRVGTPVGVRLVHVISYAQHCGSPAQGLVVAHQCHNPACCNPVHLRLMSQKENVTQSLDRGTFFFAPKRYKVPPSEHVWIRIAHAYRGKSAATLAEKYGVSKSLIEKIIYASQEG
jgi:hypothetical protein